MAGHPCQKRLRQQRIDNRLCTACGAKLDPDDKKECKFHAEKNRERSRRGMAKQSEQGLCQTTGCTNKAPAGKRCCDSCRQKTRENNTRRRAARNAQGLCSQCNKRPFEAGKTMCSDCLSKMRKLCLNRNHRLKADGICVQCGKKETVKGAPSRQLCRSCYEAVRVSRRKLRDEVFAAYGGPICVGCNETDDILQIDHIDGNGGEHRRAIGGPAKFYQWLRDNGFPKGFRVLCPSCNIRALRKISFPNDRKEATHAESNHQPVPAG
jgi:hypothetical protein